MKDEPTYWGSWEGQIIKAIAVDGARTWADIRDHTGLSPKSLNTALRQLLISESVVKVMSGEETIYRVAYNLYKEYQEYFGKSRGATRVRVEDQRGLRQWILSWVQDNRSGVDIGSKHFFLSFDLEEFSRKIIQRASREILLVNPFIGRVALIQELIDKSSKVDLTVITREPEGSYADDNWQLLDELNERGKVYINPTVHAKVLIVDRAVAVVSSMNMIPTSVSGSSWEAGLVTFDSNVVEEILREVLKLRDRKSTGILESA